MPLAINCIRGRFQQLVARDAVGKVSFLGIIPIGQLAAVPFLKLEKLGDQLYIANRAVASESCPPCVGVGSGSRSRPTGIPSFFMPQRNVFGFI